jgi:hypothetical protein
MVALFKFEPTFGHRVAMLEEGFDPAIVSEPPEGVGSTEIVNVNGVPLQVLPPFVNEGVTVIVDVI